MFYVFDCTMRKTSFDHTPNELQRKEKTRTTANKQPMQFYNSKKNKDLLTIENLISDQM